MTSSPHPQKAPTMKLLFTSLLLTSAAIAQTPLDPTQGKQLQAYPTYIDRKCGTPGMTWAPYGAEVLNDDGTVTQHFAFKTTCPNSGRASGSTVFLTCWSVTFDPLRVTVLTDLSDEVKTAHWKMGTQPDTCVMP